MLIQVLSDNYEFGPEWSIGDDDKNTRVMLLSFSMLWCYSWVLFHFWTDSPGVPPSATAHELFRGFSYVAPTLIDDVIAEKTVVKNAKSVSSVMSAEMSFSVLLRHASSSA